MATVRSGTTTVTVAVAVPPVPPSTDVMAPVVFTWSPAVVARTSMDKVQLLLARIVVPTRLILVGESVTTLVSQVPPRLSGFAISSPAGISSLKLTPVRSVAGLGLVSVNVSVTLPFKLTVAALNDLKMVGGDCACASPAHTNAITHTAKLICIMCFMRLTGIIAPLPLPVLAEYKAGVRLVGPEEVEQRASVEASEMQADFICFPEDGDDCSSSQSER